MAGDPLSWGTIHVDGRPTRYAHGGDGPLVLLLHGWALGPGAYQRPLSQLVGRGCRVLAPALPGLGATPDLPAESRTLEGYGRWIGRFLDALDVTERAMVIGHSFGGGAAIAHTHDAPHRVAYLVLLNAVGGGRWSGDVVQNRPLADRPLWDWLAHFAREGIDIVCNPAVARTMVPAIASNLLRNPLGVWNTAHLARRANLTAELAALRRRGLPVLAMSSEADSVIPRAAFDALCAAIGTDGHLVSGKHSWLLTDPDRMHDVLGNVVDLRVAEHRAGRHATRAEELDDLLRQTAMPDDEREELVDGAPALWLMSDEPRTLAADLALATPALLPDEIRAVVRPIEDSQQLRLTVVAHDRPGLLADTAAILASEGVSVQSATAMTWSAQGLAMHALTVDPDEDLPPDWQAIGEQLRAADRGDRPIPALRADLDLRITVSGDADDRTLLVLEAADQIGLLAAVCRALSAQAVSVESMGASTSGGRVRDTFIVRGPVDRRALIASIRAFRRRRRSVPVG